MKSCRIKFDRSDIVSTVQTLYELLSDVKENKPSQEDENSEEQDSFFADPLAKL